MKKTTVLLPILLLAMVLFVNTDIAAQGFGNLDGITFDSDVNDEPVPIFGHLFLLISASVGMLIGYTKLKRNK